jgi:hypothetical protein
MAYPDNVRPPWFFVPGTSPPHETIFTRMLDHPLWAQVPEKGK